MKMEYKYPKNEYSRREFLKSRRLIYKGKIGISGVEVAFYEGEGSSDFMEVWRYGKKIFEFEDANHNGIIGDSIFDRFTIWDPEKGEKFLTFKKDSIFIHKNGKRITYDELKSLKESKLYKEIPFLEYSGEYIEELLTTLDKATDFYKSVIKFIEGV